MKSATFFAVAATLFTAISGSSIPVQEREVANVKPEITAFWQNDVAFFGETGNGSANEKRACTHCVGHHGLCTIGEGNCYAPDGCYFCGGCNSGQARCQNPNAEPCQCY